MSATNSLRVRLATTAVWLKIDGERVAHSLQEAREKLDRAEGEVVLDFSGVRLMELSALRAMEELAGVADDKSRQGRVVRRQRRDLQSAQAGEASVAILLLT